MLIQKYPPPPPPSPLPPSALQAVPAYIEKVNWGSLAESLEVYSLLDQIADARQEFPMEVSAVVPVVRPEAARAL